MKIQRIRTLWSLLIILFLSCFVSINAISLKRDMSCIGSEDGHLKKNTRQCFHVILQKQKKDTYWVRRCVVAFSAFYRGKKENEKIEGFKELSSYLEKGLDVFFHENKLFERYDSCQFIKYEDFHETASTHKSEALMEFMRNYGDYGVYLFNEEGYPGVTLRRNILTQRLALFLPEDFVFDMQVKDLLEEEILRDASIVIPPIRMVKRIFSLDHFLKEYSNHYLTDKVQEELNGCVELMKTGVDNTPLTKWNHNKELTEYFSLVLTELYRKYSDHPITIEIINSWKKDGINIVLKEKEN